MNVSIETMSGLERRLTIALPSKDFELLITQKLEEARDRVSIPGFRPGKVPLKEVRRRFGKAVRAEVAGEMMQDSFISAVSQEDITPAGQPNLEVVKMDAGNDFEFTATFEVFPSVEIADLSKVSVKRPQTEITDQDLENMVDRLREQRTEFVDVDRAVEADDKVCVDFSGTLDGEAVEGTSGDDMEFVVGKGQMIEDFDNGVIGLSVGESRTFDATFPDDYRSEELKGQTVEFNVTVKSLQASQVPKLDDEFYKEFGVEEGGVDAFHDEVRSNMQREMDVAIKNQIKQQVMDELAKLHEFIVPTPAVHREIHVLKEQMLGQFQMSPQANLPDLPDELFQDQAEKRVKVGLVVNQVITDNKLEAEQDRVEARLLEMAAAYGEPEQVVAWYRSQPEQMQNIEAGILEDQVVDLILDQASVEVLDSSYDDIVSGRAVQPEKEVDPEAEDSNQEVQGEVAADSGDEEE